MLAILPLARNDPVTLLCSVLDIDPNQATALAEHFAANAFYSVAAGYDQL